MPSAAPSGKRRLSQTRKSVAATSRDRERRTAEGEIRSIIDSRYPTSNTERYPHPVRIDEIISQQQPTFSIEFFPPKTAEATEQLYVTARELRTLEPDYVSVTYGAGGSTRDGTVRSPRR